MSESPILLGNPILAQTAATPTNQLMASVHFPSTVYLIEKPEFLITVKPVASAYLQQAKQQSPKLDPTYPLYQTDNFFHEASLNQFSSYIAQTAWSILSDQGYNMADQHTYFTEMWCQEHHTHSSHDEHIHGWGNQISGFYFLDCPKDCSRIIIHDPRPGKKQINLPETDVSKATYASTMINFEPKPGLMIFTNSWLPHQVGKNAAKSPIRFVHFNLGVRHVSQSPANFYVAPSSTQMQTEQAVVI